MQQSLEDLRAEIREIGDSIVRRQNEIVELKRQAVEAEEQQSSRSPEAAADWRWRIDIMGKRVTVLEQLVATQKRRLVGKVSDLKLQEERECREAAGGHRWASSCTCQCSSC
jgi:hypothetical protein